MSINPSVPNWERTPFWALLGAKLESAKAANAQLPNHRLFREAQRFRYLLLEPFCFPRTPDVRNGLLFPCLSPNQLQEKSFLPVTPMLFGGRDIHNMG